MELNSSDINRNMDVADITDDTLIALHGTSIEKDKFLKAKFYQKFKNKELEDNKALPTRIVDDYCE